MKHYKLIIFDCDGTLTTTKSGATFRKSADDWQWLPSRLEKLHELKERDVLTAIATDQGGVAYGYMTEEAITKEIDAVALETRGYRAICFTHPKATIERYKREDDRRKPGGGMITEIMRWYAVGSGRPQTLSDVIVNQEDVLYVGDRPEDEQAAQAAACDFMWADEFFKQEN